MKYLIAIFAIFFIQSASALDVIVFNKDHYITKSNLGGYIEISIEFLSDFEDDLEGKYPSVDFGAVYFDANANSLRDADIDRYYSLKGKTLCAGFLMEDKVSRPCGSFQTSAKVFTYFLKTEIQPMPHLILKYLIPTDELFNNNDYAYVVFQLYSKGVGYSSYPGEPKFRGFETTIRLKK